MARCQKHNCKAEAAEGKKFCKRHRGQTWNKDFHLFASKDRPTRKPR